MCERLVALSISTNLDHIHCRHLLIFQILFAPYIVTVERKKVRQLARQSPPLYAVIFYGDHFTGHPSFHHPYPDLFETHNDCVYGRQFVRGLVGFVTEILEGVAGWV